jgi:hypothetical protein
LLTPFEDLDQKRDERVSILNDDVRVHAVIPEWKRRGSHPSIVTPVLGRASGSPQTPRAALPNFVN